MRSNFHVWVHGSPPRPRGTIGRDVAVVQAATVREDVQGRWWCHMASAEKYDQAVGKCIPLLPPPHPYTLPKISLDPTGKETPLAAGCGRCQPWRALPRAGKCWSSQQQENIPQVVGLGFFSFFLSQLHALGWRLVCSQRCRHRGKKNPHRFAHVFQLLFAKRDPKVYCEAKGQAGGELLSGAAA